MTKDNSSRFARRAEGIVMKNLLRWIHVLDPTQHEGARPFFAPERETWLQRIGLPSLTVLGLLCHLLIFWLLSFPYTYFVRGICEVDCITPTTGWQAGGFILVFPVISYLACLLPMLHKNAQTEKWPEVSLKLNVLLNLGGFLIVYVALQFSSMGADLYDVVRRDPYYGIHLLQLLLAVVASSGMSLVLVSWLRRSRKPR